MATIFFPTDKIGFQFWKKQITCSKNVPVGSKHFHSGLPIMFGIEFRKIFKFEFSDEETIFK